MDQQGGGGWNTGPQQPPDWGNQPQAPGRLRPLTLADVLDGMFRLLVSHWRVYLLTLGVIVIPYQILGNWLSAESMVDTIVQAFRDPFAPAPPADERFGAATDLLAVVAFLVINPLTYGLATRLASDIYEGRSPTFAGTWRGTVRRYFALLGFTVLAALIFLAAAILPFILVVAASASQSLALLVLTLLMLFAAFLFVGTKLSHGYAAIMIEGAGPGTAVGRTWRLTRGRFWRVLGTLVLCGLLVAVVIAIFAAIFTLPGVAFGPTAGVVLFFIGLTIASIFTTPLLWNAVTLLYFDGRIRQEGYDLELMTRNVVGTEPPRPPTPAPPPPPPGYGQPFG